MGHKLFAGLALFFIFAGSVSANAPQYRDGYLLVRFSETGTSPSAQSARQAIVNAAGGGTIEKMYSIVPGLGLVKLPAGTDVMSARLSFSTQSGVRYAEPDHIVNILATPNDPRFSELWGMRNVGQTGGTPGADINAPPAWDITTGSRDVIVAVLDTGIDYTHPDLAANMWVNTAELNGIPGVDDDGNGYIDDIYGYDFYDDNGDPMDGGSHGTHVAGTIGAVGNNFVGVAGVCWQVRLMALRFLGPNGGPISGAIEALQYAVNMGAHLTNNSWGGYGYSQALYDAIEASRTAGLLFVAAAGNESNDNDSIPAYPASYDIANIISVMASDHKDQRANFSNWGKNTVHVAAPGVSILSTVPGNGYAPNSGTSMAAPHVAGAAALLLAADSGLTYDKIKKAILDTADKVHSLRNLSVSEGRMNLYEAVMAATVDRQPPSPDPMEWKVEPKAVGTQTLYMEAVKATDVSGVEYYFECVGTNEGGDRSLEQLSSGWQDSPIYYRGGFVPGKQYDFRVQARDKSEFQNATKWSYTVGVEMPEVDFMPPHPDPAKWKVLPHRQRPSGTSIAMEAARGYDEIGTPVYYHLECVSTTDPAYAGNPGFFNRGPQTNPLFIVTGASVGSPGNEYTFRVRVEDHLGNLTDWSDVKSTVIAPPPVTRHVPSQYPTIQAAINASNHGDTVIVHPGIYHETNIRFWGKRITVRSIQPEDPAIVAATVIDCEDTQDGQGHPQYHEPRRAFMFWDSEGRDSVVSGITIRNATAVDNPDVRHWDYAAVGDPDRGDRYPIDPTDPNARFAPVDGRNAMGGAISIGRQRLVFDPLDPDDPGTIEILPASPMIRNCVFENCSAQGQYGRHGANGGAPTLNRPGYHADRGGDGGNAYGGAIFAEAGSAPRIQNTRFYNCYAIGGDAGDGGNGGAGGGHSNDVNAADGHRGGDGGDAGFGGAAWGGAMYFSPNCEPELINVVVRDSFVRVGQPGTGGNGGAGSAAKTQGHGGAGGNGGFGGDLRAPDSSGGAVYYGAGSRVTVVGSVFENCRVIAELNGDYSGGNGGNGGNFAGDGTFGGNGGQGGPAYFVPDKMRDLGGATATGGTGGDGGGDGIRRGLGGHGGFRLGEGGAGRGGSGIDWSAIAQNTGIWPSNMYYMSYYWEDPDNLHANNPDTLGFNQHASINYRWSTEVLGQEEFIRTVRVTTIFNSPYSPFYGFNETRKEIEADVKIDEDTGDVISVDFDNPVSETILNERELQVTPVTQGYPYSGAVGGANFYGPGCVVDMRDTIIRNNAAFSNHGGGELYAKGADATFENCQFEWNTTRYAMYDIPGDTTLRDAETDYKLEGYGGGLFIDQPVWLSFTDCVFENNEAFAGAGLYCNFAPSSITPNAVLFLDNCVFDENRADSHFVYSYAGGVYAGNSLDPYEEFYFNNFTNVQNFITAQYRDHGYIMFRFALRTNLWDNNLESDRILYGLQYPDYGVFVDNSTFSGNMAPYGAGILADASNMEIFNSRFTGNTAHVGAGANIHASDLWMRDNLFQKNIGSDFPTQGYQSQQSGGAVQSFGYGGGLFVSDTELVMLHNTFADNDVSAFGAAAYVAGFPIFAFGPQQMVNNLFVNNSAGKAGGALVAALGSDIDVQNCTFVDNIVSDPAVGLGGAILAHDAYVQIFNTILWNNAAVLGSQVAIGDPMQEMGSSYGFSAVHLHHSNVKGGQADIFVDDSGTAGLFYDYDEYFNPAQTNIDTDPLFVQTRLVDPNDATTRTFYLSQTAAGQQEQSPAVNAGLGDPEDLAMWLGFMDGVTTRTDHQPDVGIVDMGYHYEAMDLDSLPRYELTIEIYRGPASASLKATGTGLDSFTMTVTGDETKSRMVIAGSVIGLLAELDEAGYYVKGWIGTDDDESTLSVNQVTVRSDVTVQLIIDSVMPSLWVTIDQASTGSGTIIAKAGGIETTENPSRWPKGTVVTLIAVPDNSADAIRWRGTDDDTLLYQTNTVTMTESKDVSARFYRPNVLNVMGDFTDLQNAIDVAGEGDIIIMHPGEYRLVEARYFIIDKALTIQSYKPEDPTYGGGVQIIGKSLSTGWRAGPTYPTPLFFRFEGTGRDTIINGLTFRDVTWYGVHGCPGGNTSCGNPYADGANGFSLTGGVFWFDEGASATIKNCRFINNTLVAGDGGNGAQGGDGGWSGYARGGAVYIGPGADPRFINCEFVGNTVRGGDGGDGGSPGGTRGGSWENPTNPWYIWDWGPYLEYWKYSGYGGAVYADFDSAPEFVNCVFTDNVAYGGRTGVGNGMSPFSRFKIDRYGGALYAASRSRPTFTRCIFENNMADPFGPEDAIEEHPYFAFGGAVAFEDDVEIRFEECIFENNLAHHGGGIYFEHADTTIRKSEFNNNVAAFGGGLYYVGGSGFIDKTIFSGNIANAPGAQGGGIFAFGADSKWSDLEVIGNESAGAGGGIFTAGSENDGSGTTRGHTDIKNALIVRNTADKDGGGLSVNWYNTATLQNVTFADNHVDDGIGGGLFVGYNAYADVKDSILWGNMASHGRQLAVATGAPENPAVSTVRISYSLVQPGVTSLYIGNNCTLVGRDQFTQTWHPDAYIIEGDPLFVSDDPDEKKYYLSQIIGGQTVNSPAVDAGSTMAAYLGMSQYTTSLRERFDVGLVDLGYHYPLLDIDALCRFLDLASGTQPKNYTVDLHELMILAKHWLMDGCDATSPNPQYPWCGGADFTLSGNVDLFDFTLLSECWLKRDDNAPTPNPTQWDVEPHAVGTTGTSITMSVVPSMDDWSGLQVEYYFENMTDPSKSSGWRQNFDSARPGFVQPPANPWEWTDQNLTFNQAYNYRAKVRDMAGNETMPTQARGALSGQDTRRPVPNPSQWEVEPFQSGDTAISMTAATATDPKGFGVQYRFYCEEDGGLNSPWQAEREYQVGGLTAGQTYSFYTVARDTSLDHQLQTEPSDVVSVTIEDEYVIPGPPTPNPAQHTVDSPWQYKIGSYYHVITAVQADDHENVEYRFICDSNSDYSSGWRNVDNLGGFHPGGGPNIPEQYWVQMPGRNIMYNWRVQYRNRTTGIVGEASPPKRVINNL